ncbi:MAG: hypothetical protein ACR5K2_03400 [Wolbachia sp.]
MPFARIIIYSIILLAAAVFFFLRNIYKNRIWEIIFPKKVFEEKLDEDRKFNELYQKNKKKGLIKHHEMLRKKQKDIQVYKKGSEIVDIVKPVGKWTKMIMLSGGFMQHLALLINREGGQKGFWELFVKVQASTKCRYKGKGR